MRTSLLGDALAVITLERKRRDYFNSARHGQYHVSATSPTAAVGINGYGRETHPALVTRVGTKTFDSTLPPYSFGRLEVCKRQGQKLIAQAAQASGDVAAPYARNACRLFFSPQALGSIHKQTLPVGVDGSESMDSVVGSVSVPASI